MNKKEFKFKQFDVAQDRCIMKIGTDAILLGAWAPLKNAKRALDIGTGTGVIALMLAQKDADLNIDAVEIDEHSAYQARENAQRSKWANKVSVHHIPIQEFANTAKDQYDLIVTNPPFFTRGTMPNIGEKRTAKHTVKLPHGDLLRSVRKLLTPVGRLVVILPFIEGLQFSDLAKTYGLHCIQMTSVRTRADKPIERLLLEFELQESACNEDSICIYEDETTYTDAYTKLTEAYYLNM